MMARYINADDCINTVDQSDLDEGIKAIVKSVIRNTKTADRVTDKDLHKDLLGNEILIGDKVLFMQIKYRDFMEGIIKTMAEKSALISHDKTNAGKTESRQYYGQIISLSALDRVVEHLQSENTRLKAEVNQYKEFKNYFDSLYGQGLEVANWHLNGSLEPFDNFFDSAVDEMECEH